MPGSSRGRPVKNHYAPHGDSVFFQAEGGIRDPSVTGVQTCALPIYPRPASSMSEIRAGEQQAGNPGHERRGFGWRKLRGEVTVTVTLHLRPEIEASLLARAHASGMPLEAYLLSLAEEAAVQPAPTAAGQTKREEAVRRMLEFGEKHRLTLGEPITRSLLHEGHRH